MTRRRSESFLTESKYLTRIPYSKAISVDPTKTIVLVTSNRAEFTVDFAKRTSMIRLLKQPANHEFAKFLEGDLLDHVRANPAEYLGAVHAVVRAWYAAGKPVSAAAGHDFRAWARVLGWIVTNLLDAAPLMEGHQEVQRRTVSPSLTWLRDVAHAVNGQQKLGEWFRPNTILEILQGAADIEVPGLGDDDIEDEAVRDRVFKAIGRRLSECLGQEDEVLVDGYSVSRRTTPDERIAQGRSIASSTRTRPEVTPKSPPKQNLESPKTPKELTNLFRALILVPLWWYGDSLEGRGESGAHI